MENELHVLDIDRIRLKQRRTMLFPVWLGLPILSIFLTFNYKVDEPIFIFVGFAIMILIYSLAILFPFRKIKGKVKKVILEEFMKTYHPDLHYSYQQEAANGRNIAKDTDFVRFTSSHEEDVLVGNHLGANYYISELTLNRKSGKSTKTVFKGILFELTIPGKDFPNAEIRSGVGAGNSLSNLFGKVNYNDEFNFYFDTENHQKFEELLGPLFPFIQHLSKSNGGLKIQTEPKQDCDHDGFKNEIP